LHVAPSVLRTQRFSRARIDASPASPGFATLRASIAIPERPGGKSCMLKIAFQPERRCRWPVTADLSSKTIDLD
jgi:hypothetical protein